MFLNGPRLAYLEAEYLPRLIESEANPDLPREAFNNRFEELKLRKLQEAAPGLLPSEKRRPFVDPGIGRGGA